MGEGPDREYKQTNQLRRQDLPAAALLLQKAFEAMVDLEEESRERNTVRSAAALTEDQEAPW